MDSSANVKSLAEIEHFAKCLVITQSDTARQIDETRIELDRVSEYLQSTAPAYWKTQHQRAKQRWAEAREALSRCEQVTREDERRSCTEQKKQLQLAKQRVDLCENKLRSIKSYSQQWQQELTKINTHLRHVLEISESGIPNAHAALKQIIDSIRKYANLQSMQVEKQSGE